MPSLNNYTFTNIQYNIPEGSNVSILYPTVQITIVPNSGYTANAADFSIDPSFSDNAVIDVSFTQDGLNVLCTVTFDTGFFMPSSNYTIPLCVVGEGEVGEITIGGTISTNVGPNITGSPNEGGGTPYSNSGLVGETELLLTRSYTAAPGYYLTSTGLQVTNGNASNYNIVQTPVYDLDNNLTSISYAVNYTYPNQSISGDILSIFQVSAKEIYVAPQYVTSYGKYLSVIPFSGANFNLNVYGGEGAVFSAELAYDATTTPIVTNATLPGTGVLSIPISIPPNNTGSFAPQLYTITFSGDIDPAFSQPNPIILTQYGVLPRISIDAISTNGITGFSPIITQGTPLFKPEEQYIEAEWDLTVSAGTINYLNNITIGSFNNTLPVTEGSRVSGDVTNSPTVTLDATYPDIQVNDKFNLYQGEISKAPFQFNITNVSGAVLTVSPNITVDDGEDIFIFRNNGNVISSPTITATQTNSSTVNLKLSAQIDSFGDADATFTLDLDEIINYATPVACGGTVTAGSSGVSDYTVDLDPAGGMVAYLIDPIGVPDKFEIIHGLASGDKKATSSMTAANNSGPFDNVWGTEPINDIPTSAQVVNIDQFIGTDKGIIIPTKQTEFFNNTGFTVSNMTVGGITYKQIVWWEYTAADYTENPIATLRVTGASGTGWNILRLCCPDANCT
jgi:hypothetical protein